MPYVTVMQSPVYHQVTIEEILDGYVDPSRYLPIRNSLSGTQTVFRKSLPEKFTSKFCVVDIVRTLDAYNQKYSALFEVDRRTLYRHFEIPKRGIDPKTGRPKMRPIDAPCPELAEALYELKTIFERSCGALYHTNAFAYIKNRCAVDSVRRHQGNGSHWFLKTDFSNFFGNTTEAFAHYILRMIFPFSEIYKSYAGAEALEKALNLCFLDGGLPQGTPISPMLTNLLMIPIDHRLTNTLKDYHGQHYVYTRYADDILISSKYTFHHEEIVDYINHVLQEFQAPFSINASKTRYGSGNGHNYNLGVILNEKNQITIGYKQKASFRAMVHEYIKSRNSDFAYKPHEVQTLSGLLSYYSAIEPAYFERYLAHVQQKYHVDLKEIMRSDMTA